MKHDKLIHFTTFATLTIEFYFVFETKSLRTLRAFTFLICTCGASISLEIIQHVVNPKRIFDIVDIFYNVGGSLIGLVLSVLVQQFRKKRRVVNHVEIEEDYIVVEMKSLGSKKESNDTL